MYHFFFLFIYLKVMKSFFFDKFHISVQSINLVFDFLKTFFFLIFWSSHTLGIIFFVAFFLFSLVFLFFSFNKMGFFILFFFLYTFMLVVFVLLLISLEKEVLNFSEKFSITLRGFCCFAINLYQKMVQNKVR